MNPALKHGIKAPYSDAEVSLYRDLQNKNGIQGIIEYLLAFNIRFGKTIKVFHQLVQSSVFSNYRFKAY